MLVPLPGAYGWIGSGKGANNPGLHSPYFGFNDAIIPDWVSYP